MTQNLIARINAASKKAYVSVDGAPEIVCPIRKESSGHYTITLVGHVEWPRKYLSIGRDLVDKTIEKNADDYSVPSTTNKATYTAPKSLSAMLERVITGMAATPDVTDEEAENVANVLNPIIARLKSREEDAKLDAQIAALQAQLAKLVASRAKAQPAEEPAVDVQSAEYKEARVKAKAKKAISQVDIGDPLK